MSLNSLFAAAMPPDSLAPAPNSHLLLMAKGGLYETTCPVHTPRDWSELFSIFERARLTGQRVTLVGGRRSFGEHFIPPDGGYAVDTTQLRSPPDQDGLATSDPGVRRLETTDDGQLWVRVQSGVTFAQLCAAVPGYYPIHGPSGDLITISGAVSACTHDATGFLCDDMRAFTLLCPNGEIYRCRQDSTGIEGELFRTAPGAFGALGVITDVELKLQAVRDDQQVAIRVWRKRAPSAGRRKLQRRIAIHAEGFDRLEDMYRAGTPPLARGIFLFGHARASALIGGHMVDQSQVPDLPRLPLANDDLVGNLVLQSLANRFPTFTHPFAHLAMKRGGLFQATPYSYMFFQRSYDRAHRMLRGDHWIARSMRALGVDPRSTVCHQTFAIQPQHIRSFVEFYWTHMKNYWELEHRLEQQDSIRLPPSRWPLHGSHGWADGCYLFTVSFSVVRDRRSHRLAQRFLAEVAAHAHELWDVRVMLLKHSLCDPELLRRMHQGFIDNVQRFKELTDPQGTLTSRLLEQMLEG